MILHCIASHVQEEAESRCHFEQQKKKKKPFHSCPVLSRHLAILLKCVQAQATAACLPLICVHKQWPGHAPAPSSAATPPGWGHYRWPGSRSSCWLWGWLCRPAGGARCAGIPPYHWPTLAAESRQDQWNSCCELDLRMRGEHKGKRLWLGLGGEKQSEPLVADVRGLNLIFISARHKHNDLKWLLSKKKAFNSSI